jgi:5'-methylthioadenosine phosphorylase
MSNIGIIGGSGLYQLEGVEVVKKHNVETPYGSPSGEIVEGVVDGSTCFFLARHGEGHKLLPHEINYRANIYALKKLGVNYLVSVSAVGSLKEEFNPTTFVLVDQFIDWTKGKRERSFFGDGIVGHVSVANPVEAKLQEVMVQSCEKVGVKYSKGGSYICIEGPQFSSKAESEIYRGFGASVIGMTNVPESYLAKEAGMAYATIAMVTDYDCWKEEHCTLDEIMKVMKENNKNAHLLLKDLIPNLDKNKFDYKKENIDAILTPEERLSSEQKEIVKVLKS